MSTPDQFTQLINLASAAAGNDLKLAALLGQHRSTISQWRSGAKTIPAGDIALMAELSGLDPIAWGARAIAAGYEGTAKGEKIAKVLGQALAATGAAIGSASASAGELMQFIRCVNSKVEPYPNDRRKRGILNKVNRAIYQVKNQRKQQTEPA